MVCLNRLQNTPATQNTLEDSETIASLGSVIIHVQGWVPIIFYHYCSSWFLKIPGPSGVEDADHKHTPKAKRDALMLMIL